MYGKAVIFLSIVATTMGAVLNIDLREAETPESCKGKEFCFEKSSTYPQDLIDSLIDSFGDIYEVPDKIGNRTSISGIADDDCKRESRYEPIYQILDYDDNVRFVAQSDKKFIQKIRTESCLNPGRIQGHSVFFEKHHLETFNIACVESRIEFSFLALSLDGTKLEDVDVKGGLPICCSCRFVDD